MPSLLATTNMQLFRVSSELQVTATMLQYSGVARRVVWEVEAPPTLFLHFAHVCAHTPTHTRRTELLYNTRTKKEIVFQCKTSVGTYPRLLPERKSAPLDTKIARNFIHLTSTHVQRIAFARKEGAAPIEAINHPKSSLKMMIKALMKIRGILITVRTE